MKPRAVNIRVGKLILTGPQFNRREASQFRSAFERELTRLLRDQPPRATGNATYRHIGTPMQPSRTGTRPGPLGTGAARSFFETIAMAAGGQAT